MSRVRRAPATLFQSSAHNLPAARLAAFAIYGANADANSQREIYAFTARGLAQLGSAPRSGRGGREFKSPIPDKSQKFCLVFFADVFIPQSWFGDDEILHQFVTLGVVEHDDFDSTRLEKRFAT